MNFYITLNNKLLKIFKHFNSLLFSFNNLLYVLSPHPEHIKNYDKKFKPLNIINLKKKTFSHLFFDSNDQENFSEENCDLILISHCIDNKVQDTKIDPYYGNLQKFLDDRKISYLKIYRNHTNTYASNIQIDKNFNYIIFGKTFSLLKFIFSLLKILFGFIYYKFKIIFLKNNKVDKLLLKDLLNFNNIFQCYDNLVFYSKLKKIIKKFNPKYLITTYEGYAFERLAFKCCTDVNNKIIKIGYQFSFIRKGQLGIMNQLESGYDPDIILSTGKAKTNQILQNSNWNKVISVGSRKSVKHNLSNKNNQNLSILVTPEAFYYEMQKLFVFTNNFSKFYPEFQFIWRLHPLIDKNIFSEIFKKNEISKNIIISDKSLIEDISRSSHVFYRGSTSVFECVINNLIPLYFNNNEDHNIDPIYEVNKNIINNQFDLVKLLKRKYDIRNIVKYCKEYYEEENWENLNQVIN